MGFKDVLNKLSKQLGQLAGNDQGADLDGSGAVPVGPSIPGDTAVPGPAPTARPISAAPPATPARDPASDSSGASPRPQPPARTGVAGLSVRQSNSSSGTQRTAGLIQNEKNDTVYEERSRRVAAIQAMFADFGPAVSSYILTQALLPGGISRTTEKLGLESRKREGADLAQIEVWLHENGIEEFCRIVKLRTRPADTPLPMKQKEETDPRLRVRHIDARDSTSTGKKLQPNFGDTPAVERRPGSEETGTGSGRYRARPQQARDNQTPSPGPSRKINVDGVRLRRDENQDPEQQP